MLSLHADPHWRPLAVGPNDTTMESSLRISAIDRRFHLVPSIICHLVKFPLGASGFGAKIWRVITESKQFPFRHRRMLGRLPLLATRYRPGSHGAWRIGLGGKADIVCEASCNRCLRQGRRRLRIRSKPSRKTVVDDVRVRICPSRIFPKQLAGCNLQVGVVRFPQ